MTALKNKSEKLQSLKKLVDAFRRNIDQYTAQKYIEERLRTDFVDKFFELLDWDISNEEGAIEDFRDVVREDNVEIQGEQKYPDYSFRIGGSSVFFVETKKPSINVKESIPSAYQVRRYGFSGKLKISILTDFHEFAIYDTQRKPGKNDKADVCRLFYCTFEDYEKNWDFLYGLLAQENVKKGSINEYVGKATKRGASEVDKEFLKMIDGWRTELAKSIARNNKRLELEQLNMAVQKIIDRIIFLRICGEKDVEPFDKLKGIGESKKDLYGQLVSYFEAANRKYNSELFKPEAFINDLKIEDDVLADIISHLYYPSPYAFSVLPVEILGNIYEQFLGKTIHLTETHQARIEEKPEVRKAGGVYYTPKYIVDYIVKNTVGEKIKGATPKEIEKLKILDPACGSGSFLLGAYSYLLTHHLAYYTKKDNIAKAIKDGKIYQAGKNSYRLTIQEKQSILLNNIYGVDIDAQAVEVTKLSLLLKLMEGESQESAGKLFKYSDTKLLPNLSGNIKCGNSLIGPDFYKDKNLSLFGNEEMGKINAFDWEDRGKEFGEIMAKGGFDCVIGNPPYRMLQPHNTDAPILLYLRANYIASEFKIEIFHLFLQRGIALLNDRGYLGYIVPTTLLNNVYAESLRKSIMEKCCIERISVAREQVFADADVHTSVINLRREINARKRADHEILATSELSEQFASNPSSFSVIPQIMFDKLPGHVWNILINKENASLISKLTEKFTPLRKIATINRGLITGDRDKFFSKTRKSKAYTPIIAGGDVYRYYTSEPSEYILFKRPKTAGGCWDREVHLAAHKIVVRQIGLKPTASLLDKPLAVTGNIFTVRAESFQRELFYLAIINSRLIEFFWRVMFSDFKNAFPQVTIFSLSQLPIASASKTPSDNLVELASQMLEVQKKHHFAKSDTEKKYYLDKIDLLDKQIDRLVYELYGLTKKEIGVVEQGR